MPTSRRNIARSRSRSRSRDHNGTRSNTKSNGRSSSYEHNRSKTKSKSKSKSRSRSKSRTKNRSRSRSRNKTSNYNKYSQKRQSPHVNNRKRSLSDENKERLSKRQKIEKECKDRKKSDSNSNYDNNINNNTTNANNNDNNNDSNNNTNNTSITTSSSNNDINNHHHDSIIINSERLRQQIRSVSTLRVPGMKLPIHTISSSINISSNDKNNNNGSTNNSNNNNHIVVKPVFLSQKKREELALQKLLQKREGAKKKLEEDNKRRNEFMKEVRDSHNNYNNNISDAQKEADRKARLEARLQRAKERECKKQEETREQELQLIKDQYLGKKPNKKSIVPPSQKFKFNFDWEPQEDTSEDSNALYSKPAKIALRFGRGYIGGVDREQQQQHNKELWNNLVQNRDIKILRQEDDELLNILEIKRKKRKEKELKQKEMDKQDARNWRDKKLNEMNERDWRILKEEFRITTKFGGRLPNPIRYWEESNLPTTIIKAIKEIAMYDNPSPIQRMAIPVGLQNRDIVGIAETGSGKTAAFVLPMLSYLMTQPKMTPERFEDGPYAIVLVPARELAKQIEDETNKFATYVKIATITIVGGVDQHTQSLLLQKSPECIIATPGRLNDCLDQRYMALNQCNYVVLDEADKMIDMGFEPQVIAIFDKMPSTNMRPDDESKVEENRIYRQTFMFSATMPPSVERLTRSYLRNPVYITIGDPNSTAAERVKQDVLWIPKEMKRKTLQELLPNMQPPIMIFVNLKKTADTISKFLKQQGFNCQTLHGGKSQESRDYALNQFREKKTDILVCTNVAGRGIDVEGVQHVINYDMPNNIQDYCHRIGRTGRAGAEGVATSLLSKEDIDVMYDLKKMLLKTNSVCPPELMSAEAAMRNPNAPFEEKTTGKKILLKAK